MLIVGLGNPGKQYSETRHNVGFKVIDFLRKKYQISEILRKKYFNGWKMKIEGKDVLILKPKTYMNESGKAVKAAIDFFCEKIENLVIIHDDLDIELGKMKIIRDKGPGGHKGVISVIENIGGNNFIRVRIGIGRKKIEGSYVDYVLSPFSEEEKKIINGVIEKSAEAIEEILRSSLEKAMSLYNN